VDYYATVFDKYKNNLKETWKKYKSYTGQTEITRMFITLTAVF